MPSQGSRAEVTGDVPTQLYLLVSADRPPRWGVEAGDVRGSPREEEGLWAPLCELHSLEGPQSPSAKALGSEKSGAGGGLVQGLHANSLSGPVMVSAPCVLPHGRWVPAAATATATSPVNPQSHRKFSLRAVAISLDGLTAGRFSIQVL